MKHMKHSIKTHGMNEHWQHNLELSIRLQQKGKRQR